MSISTVMADRKGGYTSSLIIENKCYERKEGRPKPVSPASSLVKDFAKGDFLPKCVGDDKLVHFTQNTTLHGLKYISMPGSAFQRRLLWSLLVMTCLGVLGFQIVERIIYYYDWPINANVKVNFNKTLHFPTLTICNQNAFRASKAAEQGRYEMLTAMYSGKTSFTTSDLETFNASNLTLKEIYESAAHTKDDLIIRWRGKECGAHNFTEVMTDHGVCYSFNRPDNNTHDVLSANAPGADNGLYLTLNVEQYEYMPGPHDAAGVKILIHDYKQFPKVQELGIALPTGTHSFVGMQLNSVENLPKPHGQCMSPDLHYFSEYSLENCEIDCFTKYISSVCGCRLFYMPDKAGYPHLCTLKDYYGCYINGVDDVRQALHETCQCPVPCKFTAFDSTLSFATTSTFAIDDFLSNVNRTALKAKHQHARDITHRLHHTKAYLLRSLTEDVYKKLQHLVTLLDDLEIGINKQEMVLNEISKDVLWNWKWTNIYFQYQNFILQKNLVRARDAMDERTFSVLAHGVQEFAFSIETKIEQLVDPEINDSAVRQVLYLMTNNQLNARIDIAYRTIQNYTELITGFLNATSIFNYKFRGFLRAHSDFILPKELLLKSFTRTKSYHNWSLKIDEIVIKIIFWMEKYGKIATEAYHDNTLNITEMHLADVYFLKYSRDFLQAKNTFFHDVMQWPVDELNKREEQFLQMRQDFIKFRDIIFGYLKSVTELIANINETFLKDMKIGIEMSQDYLVFGNISKLKLAEHLISKEKQARVTNFKFYLETVRSRGHDIYDSWDQLSLATRNLWNFTLSQTDLMIYWEYRNLTRYLRNYSQVAEEISDEYIQYRDMIAEKCNFRTRDEQFLRSLENLVEHMEEFYASSHVDSTFVRDNFLRLDVFYRQLYYQKTSQQKAYDGFALLCDIGGTMGLCIGASVISIFEIVDLIINLAKRQKPIQQNAAK